MKARYLLSTILLSIVGIGGAGAATRYAGGDISLLPEYDKAKYYDPSGKPIPDFLTYCAEQGMNAMRVRLFVDPSAYKGSDKDKNACQDLEYIIPICKRIEEAGCRLMLDFHYSDTWADPAKQWTPASWATLSDSELYTKIYDYTKETLEALGEEGIVPDFIQIGNEISYGMLWGPVGTGSPKKIYASNDDNWTRFRNLLSKASKACREVCPDAAIIVHTERVAQPWYLEQYHKKLNTLDYDIIGLSYYPYFHGKISVLKDALDTLEENFPNKEVMIVETGYPYAWEVPGTDKEVDYAYTDAGQNKFMKDVVELASEYDNVTGIFWWWMEYNAKGTTLSGWYNAPLVNSNTGKVTSALATLAAYAEEEGEAGISDGVTAEPENTDQRWFDLTGRQISEPKTPGIYIRGGKKILVK